MEIRLVGTAKVSRARRGPICGGSMATSGSRPPPVRHLGGELGGQFPRFVRIEIPGNHRETTVRRVAGAVVADQILVADRIEQMPVPDDRMAARIEGVHRGEKQPRGDVVRIIEAHVDFPADDVLFLLELGLRQCRIENQPGEGLEENRQRGGRPVDVIDGAVEAGVGVPVAARRLHGVCEGVPVVVAGALEDHVLEEMRDARAEVLVLVHAAGGHPDLRADDRGRRVGIEDQGEAVRQGFDGGGGGGIFHEVLAWMGG